MDNQHRKIEGYRELTESEVSRMNMLKGYEDALAQILRDVAATAANDGDSGAGRWASLARTHIETGFMYALKAVARPTNGMGRS